MNSRSARAQIEEVCFDKEVIFKSPERTTRVLSRGGVIVAGRSVGSVKCTKCLQVCGKNQLWVWLPTTCTPWQAKDALFIPLPLGLPLNDFDHEDDETQYEDDETQNNAWQAVFDNGDEVQKSAPAPALGRNERPQRAQNLPPLGRHGVRHMWGL